jgi:hypothetical protein
MTLVTATGEKLLVRVERYVSGVYFMNGDFDIDTGLVHILVETADLVDVLFGAKRKD